MTKRGFLKSLTAGSLAGIPAVKSIEVLEITKKDTLVITFPDGVFLTQENAVAISEFVRGKFPDNEVMVLSDGAELKVLRG